MLYDYTEILNRYSKLKDKLSKDDYEKLMTAIDYIYNIGYEDGYTAATLDRYNPWWKSYEEDQEET